MLDDVAKCRLEERIEDVRPRVEDSPYRFALVVAPGGTLLGRIGKAALDSDANVTVDAAMEPGPSTVRADVSLESLRDRLDKRGFKTAVVTTPDGVLLGVVRRQDLA
jgi:predicted transcriptional regulator